MAEVSFGEWLKRRRGVEGWTQKQLAQQINCSISALRKMEAEERRPSAQVIEQLAELFNIPQNERKAFLRFARGDWTNAPTKGIGDAPWRAPTTSPRSNLPVPLTSFIGREKEQTEILKLINKYRLVTLVGSGGVGKTRLCLKVSEQLVGDYAQGVWFVELAPILDPLLVPRTTAIAIGLRDEPQRPFIEMISDYLHEKKILIMLDNCEHLLDACAQLADTLLKNCPSLRILATSREALGILGEATYRVPSLGLPDMQQLFEKFRGYESVRLFEERAQLAQMDFALTVENASSVTKICNHLNGIALAIELAAARVSTLSTEQIAIRLQESFDLLTDGNRTALPRHQTLQAAMAWSYNLLSPVEQTLFQRLSIFVEGWTLEAAEFICSDAKIKSEDILDLLTQLIKKSLVNIEKPQSETRYQMLETIRQYAHEQLLMGSEIESIRKQHLKYFLTLAEEAERQLKSPNQVQWLQRLELEHNNLRAALGWTIEQGASESVLRLSVALAGFWRTRSYLGEGRQWLQEALKVGRTQRIQKSSRTVRLYYSYALNWASELAWWQDDGMAARTFVEEALTILRELGDKYGIAWSLEILGYLTHDQGDPMAAQILHEESLVLRRELGRKHDIASSLYSLGLLALMQGDLDTARARYTESLKLWRELGYKEGIAGSLNDLGRIARNQGDYITAQTLFEESLMLWRELGIKQGGIIRTLEDLGTVALAQGNYSTAQNLFEETLVLWQESGVKSGTAGLLGKLGLVALANSDHAKAWKLFKESLTLLRGLNRKRTIIEGLVGYVSLAFVQKQWRRAVKLSGAIATNLETIGSKLDEPEFTMHDHTIMALHAQLDEVIFKVCWTEGQKMTLDEAVSLALEESLTTPSSSSTTLLHR